MRHILVFQLPLAILVFAVLYSSPLCGQFARPKANNHVSLSDQSVTLATEINWLTDIEQAQAIAAKENKYVLIHFWGAQCRPCLRLDSFVFNQPPVIRAIMEAVVPVKIQDEKQPQVFIQYGVRTMPHDIVIAPSGKVVIKRPSPKGADGYIKMMNRLAELNQANLKASNRKTELRPNARPTQSLSESQINHLRERDLVLRREHITNQLEDFRPKPDGIVFNPKPIEPEYHPDSVNRGQFNTPVPDVKKPKVEAPKHRMPQIDAKSVDLINKLQMNTSIGDAANPLAPVKEKKINNPHFQQQPKQTGNTRQAPRRHSLADSSQTESRGQTIKNQFVAKKLARANKSSTKSYVPAIDGFCSVTLMTEKKWTRGDKDWGCFHRGRLFLFVSRDKRDQFMNDPERYCPALIGMDPVVLEQQGRLIDAGVATGLIVEYKGRPLMVLFSSEESKAEFNKSNESKIHYLQVIETAEKSRSLDRTAKKRNSTSKIR